jgi:hypothetical protein
MRLREKSIALIMLLLLTACGTAYAESPGPSVVSAPTATSPTHKAHLVRHKKKPPTPPEPKPKKVIFAKKVAPAKPRVIVSRSASVAGMSFKDLPKTWQRIAMCESTDNLRASNPSGKYLGAFQIERGWWRSAHLDYRSASLAQQYALALRIWHQQGWSAWTCAGILGIG